VSAATAERGERGEQGRERARHRARSPIVPPGPLSGVLAAALAGLLAAGAPHGEAALLPGVVALQALTAAGWFRLNGMWPARQGIALAFAGGLAADAALLLTSAERAGEALLGTLGAWFLLVLVVQLRHRGSADERLHSLTATAAATVLTVAAAGHLAAVAVSEAAVTVTALGVAAAVLAWAIPAPGAVSAVLALLAATGTGAGAQAAGMDGLTGAWGAGLGAAAGCCALIGLRVASYDFPSRFVHLTAGVALPLTAAAPAVYPLARALV
jgi:hypothetical protein